LCLIKIRLHDLFCFNFVRVSWSYNSGIVLNELINVDLAHFYVIFLIKSFTNFIIQYWVWQGQLGIELDNLFWLTIYGVIYEVILVPWLRKWVWQVNLGNLFSFFFLLIFFQLRHLILGWLEIKLYNSFWLAFNRVIIVL
jgi:hypothetical protein